MKKIAYIVVCLLLLLVSCKPVNERDKSVPPIDFQTMEDILYWVHIEEILYSQNYFSEEKANRYYAWIFSLYNTNLTEFQEANIWYNNHPKIQEKLYRNLIEKYKKEVKKIGSGIYYYYLPPFPSIWTYWGKYPEGTSITHVIDLLPYYQLPATELRTNDSCSYPYIERLRSTTPYWKVRNK